MIEIRRCQVDEVEELMMFIDAHWQRGHVLGSSRRLMDWQHRAEDGAYNYLIAWDGDRILGVLGYIVTSRFDRQLLGRDVVWLALWKVREDLAPPGLGLRLLRELDRQNSSAAIAVNGINVAHPPIYRALGYRVVELSQQVLLNPDATQSLILGASDLQAPKPQGTSTRCTEVLGDDLDRMAPGPLDEHSLPLKTPEYFNARFLRHPFYRYRVFRLDAPAAGTGLMALRIAEHERRRAVRIVDFAGDPALLASCGVAVARICAETGAEYADLWSWGIDPAWLAASGFTQIDPLGATVVPNYFEPFLSRNARILCAFRCSASVSFRVFRADGDQDRPNRLAESM